MAAYVNVGKRGRHVDPLTVKSLFDLDFLSVHPFNDGNRRMVRLLTLLLLYQYGFEFGRHISHEKIIKSKKKDYYEVHRLSSFQWHRNQQDSFPWINYFLSTILVAHKKLENRIGLLMTKEQNTNELIRRFVEGRITLFTKVDVRNACHEISEATINRILRALRDEGFFRTWQKYKVD